jgi:hypothetical protein
MAIQRFHNPCYGWSLNVRDSKMSFNVSPIRFSGATQTPQPDRPPNIEHKGKQYWLNGKDKEEWDELQAAGERSSDLIKTSEILRKRLAIMQRFLPAEDVVELADFYKLLYKAEILVEMGDRLSKKLHSDFEAYQKSMNAKPVNLGKKMFGIAKRLLHKADS